MKKRGFTLVEMLAVLVLVVILSLIVFPSIINYINSSKGDISNVTKEMILSNAKLYVSDNKLTYPSDEGYSYCMTLKKLADKNYIETPFKDSATGEEIDLENTYIKVQYIYDYDLKTLKYTYDIVDSCTPGIADGYTMVSTTDSVITLDNKEIVDYKIYGNSEGIKNITIKSATYEPYKDIKQNIQVSNALKENDYVEYKSNTIFREDKTEEKINLPKIETYDGISNIIIIDENKNYPSKVEVLIRNKNKA